MEYPVNYFDNAFSIESLRLEKSGLIAIEGTIFLKDINSIPLSLELNGLKISDCSFYKICPPLQKRKSGEKKTWRYEQVYLINSGSQNHQKIKLSFNNKEILNKKIEFKFIEPAFHHLLTTNKVLGRDQIYGSGPPIDHVTPEVWALAESFNEPILDFGCGTGSLIKKFEDHGKNCFGLEISTFNTNYIVKSISNKITFYEGGILPFEDNAFESCIATEVIEHVENYNLALSEISRICRKDVLITVPDIMSIPIMFPSCAVPWHLLEATHCNFFTFDSLKTTLEQHFSKVSMHKILPVKTNDCKWYVSLAAVCSV